MANTAASFGFTPFTRVDGAAPSFRITRRLIKASNATAIFKGDPVSTDRSTNLGYIIQSAAGTQPITGIFWGCKYYSTGLKQPVWSPYWPGSGATGDVEAYVISDPEAAFLVATRGNSGNPVTTASITRNAQFYLGAGGNTTTGISSAVLDDNTIASTATLPFRIVDIANTYEPPGVNGGDNTTIYNWVVVEFNNIETATTTAW